MAHPILVVEHPRWQTMNKLRYRNVPKFSAKQVCANSVDPDETAPRRAVWSVSTLFAIPAAPFGLNTLWYSHIVQFLGSFNTGIFRVSKYLGILR